MATLTQLVSVIATTEGIDVERVGALARAIREAGLVRTSGRGTSAAQMEERDAANLLIAVNTADTARTAPEVVQEYRSLQAKRNRKASEAGSEFGNELEELIWSARRKCLANYVMKTISLFGKRNHLLGRRPYPNEAYKFWIEFEKPTPSVLVNISRLDDPVGDYVDFKDRRQQASKATGDRSEKTRITQRTIHAVADVLRT